MEIGAVHIQIDCNHISFIQLYIRTTWIELDWIKYELSNAVLVKCNLLQLTHWDGFDWLIDWLSARLLSWAHPYLRVHQSTEYSGDFGSVVLKRNFTFEADNSPSHFHPLSLSLSVFLNGNWWPLPWWLTMALFVRDQQSLYEIISIIQCPMGLIQDARIRLQSAFRRTERCRWIDWLSYRKRIYFTNFCNSAKGAHRQAWTNSGSKISCNKFTLVTSMNEDST